jgi:thiamine kinase-like enzyme
VIQRGYLKVVTERGFRLPDGYLDHMSDVERLARVLALKPIPTVPCNNDLLAGNFIDTGTELKLIDYEYSGNNDPCFELGNIWSEANLPPEALEALCDAYFGGASRALIARCRLMGLMSKYGWTLWASIQDAVSPIVFDFWSWGMEKYERAQQEFAPPTFIALLDALTGDD